MIFSNKLAVSFNRRNIERDFEIYRFQMKGERSLHVNAILDIPSQEYQARAVAYTFGDACYAIFEKGKFQIEEFKQNIHEKFPQCIVSKVDILNERSIYPNLLTQLLINMIQEPKREEWQYNNVSGALYYYNSKWKKQMSFPAEHKQLHALRIRVTTDMFLVMEVNTFSTMPQDGKSKKRRPPFYIFDEKSKKFRRKLKQDIVDQYNVYAKISYVSKKNVVDFLNFSSAKKYAMCKVGILEAFMNEVRNKLSAYITIDTVGYEEYSSYDLNEMRKAKMAFETNTILEQISNVGIRLVDGVKNTDSNALITELSDILKEQYGVTATLGEIDNQQYNIRILRNEGYYKENKELDPYSNRDYSAIIQHITLDDFGSQKDKRTAIEKILQELVIKKDVEQSCITTVDWESSSYKQAWSFVTRYGYWVKQENGEKRRQYIYYNMTINPDGTFSVDKFTDEQYILSTEQELILGTYTCFNKEYLNRTVDGLVYRDINNIQVIMRTEQRTLPNYKNLGPAIRLADKKRKIETEVIIEAAEMFLTLNPAYKEYVLDVISKIRELGGSYAYIEEINRILNLQRNRKSGKLLNRYIYDETGILINTEIKSADFEQYYSINSLLDIKYFYKNDKLYYFVGKKKASLKMSLHNACVVREVVATGNTIEFDEMMPLMAVEFVRNGQYTVVPFPFKYLNEVHAIDETKKKQEETSYEKLSVD